MNTIRTQTEHEARQLAARYFAYKSVQIVASHFKGEECYYLAGSDKSIVRPSEYVLFEGLGKDAGKLDEPLAWTENPKWERGLWMRRIVYASGRQENQVLEWDGMGDTPDVELPLLEKHSQAWLGPLPPLPF